jgi:menaquinone-dependent protoporphyrinogen IX oxidase
MATGIVLYESRYGAAQQYAQWIGEALNIPVKRSSEISPWELAGYDYIIAGASIYMGKTLISEWLREYEVNLRSKKVLLFIVGAAPATEKEKTEQYFTNNVPAQLLTPGNHFYFQGQLEYNKLSLKDKFFLKVGAWLANKPEDKKAMLTDFNAVTRNTLFPLLNACNGLFCQQVKSTIRPAGNAAA